MSEPVYNPREVVTDGPYTAERRFQHVLKCLIALAIYAGARDVAHLSPLWASGIASPLFMVLVTVKEWCWSSDPNEHAYPFTLRALDFLCDASCSAVAIVAACCALEVYLAAVLLAGGFFLLYRCTRHGARP